MNKYIRIQKEAFDKGFAWQSDDEALNKIQEELNELKIESKKKCINGVKEELGDLVFSCLGFSVFANVDINCCLEATYDKFKKRLDYVLSSANNKDYSTLRMLWEDAKSKADINFVESKKRIKVAIIGCWDESNASNLKLAKKLAGELSKLDCFIFTGGGDGIMKSVNEGVAEYGGMSISFSAYDNPDAEDNKNISLVIPTGMGWDVRSALLMRTVDVTILIGGAIGSLQEVSMSYLYKKPIIVVSNTGGLADKLKDFCDTDGFLDHRKNVPLLFLTEIEDIVKNVISGV
ncbi:TPA: hypothetical protein REW71_004557 [Klebsiella pneumoniae]|nr:hypothetical protein [Klebsiella pneumoniae]